MRARERAVVRSHHRSFHDIKASCDLNYLSIMGTNNYRTGGQKPYTPLSQNIGSILEIVAGVGTVVFAIRP